jgi:hypothetical protein
VALTDKSGVAGVIRWIQERYDLDNGDVAKDDPRIGAINAWIAKEYEGGRITCMSDEEMDAKVHELFGAAAQRKPETL